LFTKLLTTKLLVRPGTEYYFSTVPRAVTEYLKLKQGDVLVWEFDKTANQRKLTACIRKGSGDELDGEVEE